MRAGAGESCRRIDPRQSSDDAVEVLYPCYTDGMVVNQSEKGMRLWLRQPVKVGEQIGLVVRRGNVRTARKATVVWIRRTIAGYAAGVTFG